MIRRAAPLLVLAAAALWLFGPHALRAGLHLDDHGFHRTLAGASFADAWPLMRDYVPGRNLHVLYTWLMYRVLGPSPARLHALGLLLDAALAPLVFLLLRQRGVAARWALVGAGMFLVWPNRGETHYWTSSIAMNLLSTALVLCAFLAAGSRLRPAARWPLAAALYALALFDYDQAFFLWPLLVWHGLRDDEPRGWPAAAAAAFCAMNAAHLGLRLFWPVAAGGRPVPTFGLFTANLVHELGATLVPLRKLPAWPSLRGWAGGPVAAVLSLCALSAAWLWTVKRQQDGAVGGRRAAAFAVAWFFLAYLPNDFWYIAPRHNLLPAVAVAFAAALAAPRVPLAIWFLPFGLGGAVALADGFGWSEGARLHAAFQAQAPALAPGSKTLFVLGAPSSVARGPAFEDPSEACWLYAETGRALPDGSLNVLPTRDGFFVGSEVELFGRENWRWLPRAGADVLRFVTPDRFERGEPELSADLWLESAVRRSGTGKPGLARAALARRGDAMILRVGWRAAGPAGDRAWTFALLDASGAVVAEPVYRQRVGARLQPPMLWPVRNELLPASGWKTGDLIEETVRLRPTGSPAAARRIAVTVWRPDAGRWRPAERHEAALENTYN